MRLFHKVMPKSVQSLTDILVRLRDNIDTGVNEVWHDARLRLRYFYARFKSEATAWLFLRGNNWKVC